MKQTTFKQAHTDQCETRRYTTRRGPSWVGHTLVYISCPFCGNETEAHLWSLCGGGKRCETEECGAIFGGLGNAYNLRVNL